MKNCFLIIFIVFGSTFVCAQTSKKPLSEEIANTLKEKGMESAMKRYHYLKANAAKEYDFSESQLEVLGHALVKEGFLEQGIDIYKLNASEYPKSSKAQYNLGYAYTKDGDKVSAITSLKRSIELDGNNTKSKALLSLLNTSKDPKAPKYVCPPCACSMHAVTFGSLGKCPECSMGLVLKP